MLPNNRPGKKVRVAHGKSPAVELSTELGSPHGRRSIEGWDLETPGQFESLLEEPTAAAIP